MERIAGPIIAAFLIAGIAGGVYAYSLHAQLGMALAAQAAAEQKAVQATQANQTTMTRMSQNTASLNSCQTQLQEATNRADAAEQAMQFAQTKAGGGKKR